MLLSILNRLAFPYSRLCSFIILVVTILLYMVFDFKRRKRCAYISVILICVVCLTSVVVDPRERRGEYQSPLGKTTLIIEYDHASRPSIYRKDNFIFKSPIPFQFGPGYNETVKHEIVWLNEQQIKLMDHYGDEWVIDL
jgi:hypothetical protein